MAPHTHSPAVSDGEKEIIPVPALKRFLRITPGADMKLDISVIARADLALEGISEDFPKWMGEEIVRLRGLRLALRTGGLTADTVKQLYYITHNLRGQAATLGFPLAGQVAGSLCEVIENISAETIPSEVIDHHVDAISAIVHEKAGGEGNVTAQKLVAKLREVTKEYLDYMQARAAAPAV